MGLGFSVYGIQFVLLPDICYEDHNECCTCTSSVIVSAVNIITDNNKNFIANA
jgi:hypothetical protein